MHSNIYLGGRSERPPARRKKARVDHLLNTIRNLDFHVSYQYHLQTLGPCPIISLICPEFKSNEIWVRTLLFLPLGQDKCYHLFI